MELNGCRQRIVFARQLTQRKCTLYSQGTDRRVPRKQLRDRFRLQFPSRSANVANCIYSGGFSCVVSVITRPKTDKRAQETQCQREKIVGNTGNECKDTPSFLYVCSMQLGAEGRYGNLRDLTALECESIYEYEIVN